MNAFIEKHGKAIFWLVGLIIPLLAIILQMISGFDNAPLTMLMFIWFGIGLFIYLGMYEE